MATSPPNVIKAFQAAGIITSYNENVNTLICHVDRDSAIKVRHWKKNRISINVIGLRSVNNATELAVDIADDIEE